MALDIHIEISDIDQSILEYRMIDVKSWLNEAVANNINIASKNMLREWLPKLDYPTVPGGKAGLIVHILNHPDYKNRAMRDAEEWQNH